jgi:hypothetical protein
MMIASFLAVAVIAICLPFLKAILLKNLASCPSFKLPIALAAFLSAIFRRPLPLGVFLLKVLPPDILLVSKKV